MNATIPMISALYAAILGFLGAALTVNVIVNRVRSGVDAGDGGVAKLARKSKLSREATYRMLSKSGNPELRSLHAMLRAAGLRLSVRLI